MTIIKCIKCGAEMDSSAKFCGICGAQQNNENQPSEKFCPSCGSKLEDGARFCPKCGASPFSSSSNNQSSDNPVQNVKQNIGDLFGNVGKSLAKAKASQDEKKAPMPGAIKRYEVLYIGGLPCYGNSKSGYYGLNIMENCFYFKCSASCKENFNDFQIPYSNIIKFEIVPRTISNTEWLIGSGSNMNSMQQLNNLEITFEDENSNNEEYVLRVEMLTGVSIYGQAGKCREMLDEMRTNKILKKFKGEKQEAAPQKSQEDIVSEIEKLASLKEKGILTEEEFMLKKTALLNRL